MVNQNGEQHAVEFLVVGEFVKLQCFVHETADEIIKKLTDATQKTNLFLVDERGNMINEDQSVYEVYVNQGKHPISAMRNMRRVSWSPRLQESRKKRSVFLARKTGDSEPTAAADPGVFSPLKHHNTAIERIDEEEEEEKSTMLQCKPFDDTDEKSAKNKIAIVAPKSAVFRKSVIDYKALQHKRKLSGGKNSLTRNSKQKNSVKRQKENQHEKQKTGSSSLWFKLSMYVIFPILMASLFYFLHSSLNTNDQIEPEIEPVSIPEPYEGLSFFQSLFGSAPEEAHVQEAVIEPEPTFFESLFGTQQKEEPEIIPIPEPSFYESWFGKTPETPAEKIRRERILEKPPMGHVQSHNFYVYTFVGFLGTISSLIGLFLFFRIQKEVPKQNARSNKAIADKFKDLRDIFYNGSLMRTTPLVIVADHSGAKLLKKFVKHQKSTCDSWKAPTLTLLIVDEDEKVYKSLLAKKAVNSIYYFKTYISAQEYINENCADFDNMLDKKAGELVNLTRFSGAKGPATLSIFEEYPNVQVSADMKQTRES